MRRILPLLFLVTSGCLCGQSISGSIQGSVVDPSDLAVAGAKVTLTQVATGAQRSMQASERGDFYFGALQPGQYTISVEFSGFKTLQKEGLNLTAAESHLTRRLFRGYGLAGPRGRPGVASAGRIGGRSGGSNRSKQGRGSERCVRNRLE